MRDNKQIGNVASKAALLSKTGKVIGEIYDPPEKGNTIEVAGAFTVDGDPVNVVIYRISRSKKNLEKASFEQPVFSTGRAFTFTK